VIRRPARPERSAAPGRAESRDRIRRARLADAPAIARVMRAAVRGVAPGTYPPRTVAAWASLPALYHAWAMSAGGETLLVAERAGGVVAYAGLRGDELTALFVAPRVGRRGLATALLLRVEALARRRGVRALRVDAAASGLAFYRARGFAGARRVRVPLPGGVALAAVQLRKRLG
jgi:ribosomal protein S18 acetylase RimI-like enzyme